MSQEPQIIAIEAGPARLDKALAEACPDYSRSRLKALILAGDVTCNGLALTDPSAKVNAGQKITITLPPLAEAAPQAQGIPLDVVFEDEHLILINKAPGHGRASCPRQSRWHVGQRPVGPLRRQSHGYRRRGPSRHRSPHR